MLQTYFAWTRTITKAGQTPKRASLAAFFPPFWFNRPVKNQQEAFSSLAKHSSKTLQIGGYSSESLNFNTEILKPLALVSLSKVFRFFMYLEPQSQPAAKHLDPASQISSNHGSLEVSQSLVTHLDQQLQNLCNTPQNGHHPSKASKAFPASFSGCCGKRQSTLVLKRPHFPFQLFFVQGWLPDFFGFTLKAVSTTFSPFQRQ